MKHSLMMAFVSSVVIGASSCGINQAVVLNHNANTTQVHLGSNNFRVVDKAKGQATVQYICGIGGINRRTLYAQAYSEMRDNANLKSASKTVANVVTEEHIGGLPPFFIRRTVTVSGDVIEFTK